MAKSSFEYVRKFEVDDSCLPNTWIIIRVDGKNFHRFSEDHKFSKPNDAEALHLMSKAASCVMLLFPRDIILAYGQSDEYSFAFRPGTSVYRRRASKLVSQVVSLFSSSYVFHWRQFMGDDRPLLYPPTFDARHVLYPSVDNLRDYFSWRQADCHINNLYNTAFWALVQQDGCSRQQACAQLQHTLAADKNELLFAKFGVNYNNEPPLYRKGTVLVLLAAQPDRGREEGEGVAEDVSSAGAHVHQPANATSVQKISDSGVLLMHCDIIGERFWKQHTTVLDNDKKLYK